MAEVSLVPRKRNPHTWLVAWELAPPVRRRSRHTQKSGESRRSGCGRSVIGAWQKKHAHVAVGVGADATKQHVAAMQPRRDVIAYEIHQMRRVHAIFGPQAIQAHPKKEIWQVDPRRDAIAIKFTSWSMPNLVRTRSRPTQKSRESICTATRLLMKFTNCGVSMPYSVRRRSRLTQKSGESISTATLLLMKFTSCGVSMPNPVRRRTNHPEIRRVDLRGDAIAHEFHQQTARRRSANAGTVEALRLWPKCHRCLVEESRTRGRWRESEGREGRRRIAGRALLDDPNGSHCKTRNTLAE